MFKLHGAICPDVWCIASSSSVGGSGTLQYGIRTKVAAWAWMGHEDAVTKPSLHHWALEGHERSASRGRFPSAQQRSEIMIEIFLKKIC